MNILNNRQLASLNNKQLKEIATLIYDTDPYIYPAMFSSLEDAQHVIPAMIKAEDTMFNKSNLFLAENDGCIAGLILWHKGPLLWSKDIYLNCGGTSKYIDTVTSEYFSSYSEIPKDLVSIINVCVNSKLRGQGIGKYMLDAFFRTVTGPYELYVLSDNKSAISLYKNKGFIITETLQGFCLDKRELPCLKMVKNDLN